MSPESAVNLHPLDRSISVMAGSVLAVDGLFRGSWFIRLLKIGIGTELLRRGVTGHSRAYRTLGIRTAPVSQGARTAVPYELGVFARAAVTIAKPRSAVFQFWRELENLPRFMKHLLSVEVRDRTHSHWIAQGPAGKTVEWDAEIHNEIENELIGWRSLLNSEVDSAGSVRFKDAPGNRGTEVHVELQYNPPAGSVGAFVAKLFGKDPQTEIESDLIRLKEYLESGEIARTDGQSHGSKTARKPMQREQPVYTRQEMQA